MIWITAQTSTLPVDPTGQWLAPLISLGGFGLLIVLVLVGRLVTKMNYDEMRADRDAWRTAAELANRNLSESQSSLKQLMDAGGATNALLNEIKASIKDRTR